MPVGVGGTLQATDTGELFGHENNLVFGGSIDHSNVDFQSATEVGVFNSSLQVVPSGFFVDTPENTAFQRHAGQLERDQRLLRHFRHRHLQRDAELRRHGERPLQPRQGQPRRPRGLQSHRQQPVTAASILRSAAPTRSLEA